MAHNGQGGIPWESPALKDSADLYLLPQPDPESSPACLDGSPYGPYFRKSPTNSTKWTVSIEGGGWCYNETLCYERSKTQLGTSTVWPKTSGCQCMNPLPDGTLDANCNCLFMRYGDGASFSGFRAKPWPVPSAPGKTLTFRGIKNFDATMDWAFAHGMTEATEFVLTGGSAGGLSTFLHADRIAARLAAEAPKCAKVRAAPVVGYFLDHDNFAHSGYGNTYTGWMEYIYKMQNLTFGGDAGGALSPDCGAAFPFAPSYCFMSPHMQAFIKTPFFMFNSKYDAWQMGNELQTRWTPTSITEAQHAAVLQYGDDFLSQFGPVGKEGKNGAMITSCICHGCPWSTLTTSAEGDGGKTSYEHYADWYYGKTSGEGAVHIDPRLPNGGGALTDPHCTVFPAAAPKAAA